MHTANKEFMKPAHRRQLKSFDDFYALIARRRFDQSKDIMPSVILSPVINWGRWVVECPFCSGAELYWDNEPSYFLCGSCLNNGTKQAIQVSPRKDRKAIEDALKNRTIAYQNWSGESESVRKLLEENVLMGVK